MPRVLIGSVVEMVDEVVSVGLSTTLVEAVQRGSTSVGEGLFERATVPSAVGDLDASDLILIDLTAGDGGAFPFCDPSPTVRGPRP